jgi:hypothetical protein
MCRDHGVIVQEYVTDMGAAFTSKAFTEHLEKFEQVIRFAGAGGHHHNSKAERAIRTVTCIGRTMLFHQAIHWAEVSDAVQWPFALRHAEFLVNHIPNPQTGHSPFDLFSKTKFPVSRLQDLHPWGCPAYCLDKRLADGQKIPRFQPRSTRMIYMGVSPRHASTVPMILNPLTGAIKAVFHVVFDDYFYTVSSNSEDLPDFQSPEWTQTFGESEFQYPLEEEEDPDGPESPPPIQNVAREARVRQAMETAAPDAAPSSTAHEVSDLREPDWREQPVSNASAPTTPPVSLSREQPKEVTPSPPKEPTPSDFATPQWLQGQGSNIDDSDDDDHPRLPDLIRRTDDYDSEDEDDDDDNGDVPGSGASKLRSNGSCRPPSHPFRKDSTDDGSPGSQRESNDSSRAPSRTVGVRSVVTNPVNGSQSSLSPNSASTNSSVSNFMAPKEVKKTQYNPNWKKEEPDYWKPSSSKRERKPDIKYTPGESMTSKHKAYTARPDSALILEDSMLDLTTDWSLVPASFHTAMFVEAGLKVPFAYAAKKADPDTFTFEQCMRSPEKQEWMESMLREIRSLEQHGTWVEVDMDEPEGLGIPVIPSLWTMRNKRAPSGMLTKRKSRITFRGDMEKANFDLDTASPVVAWSTLRVLLVLSLFLGWETVSSDFESAFVQSKVTRPMYMHMPRGFKSKSLGRRCLKLLKSLYGSATAPKDWFNHLTDIFRKLGLQQSQHDPCLWFKPGQLIVALFVDDNVYCYKDKKVLDEFVAGLRKEGLVLTVESSLSEYLGIQIERDDEAGTIKLTQPGLTEKVLASANMSDCATSKTPAKLGCLGMDPDGEPMNESWQASSVNGMLLYLAGNTRPDIQFAVSQVCRFNHNPKKSHLTAIKHILRYLKGTPGVGMVVKKAKDLRMDVYVDADFASRWGVDPDTEPSSAKSRMGYVVYLGHFPLFWKSKLIDCICLSTAESEYSALSSCLRDFIPVQRVVLELAPIMGYNGGIPTTVHEDNTAAMQLATTRQLSSRTRYYATKLHFWWQWFDENSSGPHAVKIQRVETKLQDADYLTKSLPAEAHLANRLRVQGC